MTTEAGRSLRLHQKAGPWKDRPYQAQTSTDFLKRRASFVCLTRFSASPSTPSFAGPRPSVGPDSSDGGPALLGVSSLRHPMNVAHHSHH